MGNSIIEMRVDFHFQSALIKTNNDYQAAAILTLALAVAALNEQLDHKICMGVRHGLFGELASANACLLDLKGD